jgi:hypothetical protein
VINGFQLITIKYSGAIAIKTRPPTKTDWFNRMRTKTSDFDCTVQMAFQQIDEQRQLHLQMATLPLLLFEVLRLFVCLLLFQHLLHCDRSSWSSFDVSFHSNRSLLTAALPCNFILLAIHLCLILSIHRKHLLWLLITRLAYILMAVALLVLLFGQFFWINSLNASHSRLAHKSVQRSFDRDESSLSSDSTVSCDHWPLLVYLKSIQLLALAASIVLHVFSLCTLDLHVLQKCATNASEPNASRLTSAHFF